ncbi:MAG: S41 family peptidase [Clostridia bacterium]|nr:S41 family peptidase [Clostridia bacterium]
MFDDNFKFDKNKFIYNILTGTIVTVVSGVILISILIVADPFNRKILTNDNKEFNEQINRISDAFKRVRDNYIGDIDMEKLANGAISGLTAATGDPYTRYVSEEEYNDMKISGTEEYGGIGVHIVYDKATDGILILSVMPGSPALENGLNPGDIIIAVNDKKVTSETYQECVDNMKGEIDTQVKISYMRDNTIFEKTITRKNIKVNNIESKVLDNNIGYIKILSFDNNIADQFKNEYDNLRSKNIKGLVIDLRNNPGGLVDETVKIAKMILPKGEIVRLVYKDGTKKVYECDGKNEIKIQLTVLVNERSASASEILSGAIKDSKKGTLIGTKTYGKGIVQNISELDGDGALSITSAKYYTASGIEIHKNGIEPNIVVELPDDVKNNLYIPYDKDIQLKKAVEVILGK